ncbi:hypothetical protein [Tateyamaria sp. syn59]|uniref:hypothetical protein n=1 Tax=Tateyamaria sp. syn59 TaxID=2576942 RepID=UPI0011BEF5D9|nr:hypothetical protein [Tateyamaria sp. syn59]
MTGDIRIYLVMLAIGGSIILGVSLVPPLTTSGVEIAPGVTQEEFEKAVSQELDYCEGLADDLDCQCYADVSGYIRANESVSVPFTRSIDQTTLARRQAAEDC